MMPDILYSPIWQFVGAIFALLAILLTLSLYLKQRRRKALAYVVISSADLLSIEEGIRRRVKILFDDAPVESVRLIIIKLVNPGELPISKDDYESPVQFRFGKNSTVLSYEIIHKVPANLPVELSINSDGIIFNKILLNSGDSVTVKVLVSGRPELRVEGRIEGVKEIVGSEIRDRPAYNEFNLVTYLFSVGLFIIAWVVAFNISQVKHILDNHYWVGFLLVLIICLLPFAAIKLGLRAFARMR